jgi:hypothetical protein
MLRLHSHMLEFPLMKVLLESLIIFCGFPVSTENRSKSALTFS